MVSYPSAVQQKHPFSTTVLMLLALCLPVASLATNALSSIPGCTESTLPGNDPAYPDDQLILTCMPPPGAPLPWNGVLVVYAHGYEYPSEPLVLPELTAQGVNIPQVLTNLGFAFATSSYHKNGYAVAQGSDDLNALVAYFKANVAPATRVLVIGASEGGLIATLLVERYPDTYDGGLALCGPLGGANLQAAYLGDFRAVFDYFFPQVFPGFGIIDVPPDAWQNWPGYTLLIQSALNANPSAAAQLQRVTGVAVDPADPAASFAQAAVDVLAYNIGASNDLFDVAGGNPYGNLFRWYRGSGDDHALNHGVERVRADANARRYLVDYYQPRGKLKRPLIAMHTTNDEIVPFAHEILYALSAGLAGSGQRLTLIPIPRYGHCNFQPLELIGAFALLVNQTGVPTNDAVRAYERSTE